LARWQHRAAPACPPAGAFTISIYGYVWLLLQHSGDFTTAHMRPPRQALPSFRVEMAYAVVFFCYRNSSSETGLHPTRAVSPAASTLRPAVLRIVTVTGASFCGSVTS